MNLNFFKTISLKSYLLGFVLTVILLQALFAFIEFSSLSKLNQLVNTSYDRVYMINSFGQDAKFNFGIYDKAVLQVLESRDLEDMEKHKEEMSDELETVFSDISIIEERVDKSSEIHEVNIQLLEKLNYISKSANKLIATLSKSDFSAETEIALAREWVANEYKGEIYDDFDSLSDLVSEQGYLLREEIKKTTTEGYQNFFIYSVLFISIVFVIYLLIKLNVINPIARMTDDFETIAKGHYEMEVEVRDEATEMGKLAASFNILLSNFHNSLLQVKHASASKDQFMANISHELRTPLNAILGFSKLLLGDKQVVATGSENTDAIREIHNSGKHLLALINDILDYNKIQSSNFEINPEPARLLEVVSSSISLVKVKADEKDLKIFLDENFNSKLVVAIDDLRMKQVLINLLNNAIKFTDEGEVTLKVKREELGEKVKVYFEVEDTGIGMSPEGQSKIFDFYGQAEKDTQKKYGGTGLGLPICKSLVERMGGSIKVESEQGKGTRFSFSLEFERLPEHLAPASIMTSYNNQQSEVSSTDASLNILLAEDNVVNQKLFQAMMKSLGHEEVDIAENGREAVEKCKESKYDLIFMDMQMPEMNGIEATKVIISEHGENSPSIFALTANNFKEDVEACEEAGMLGYLTKPLEKDLLETTLNNFLSSSSLSGNKGEFTASPRDNKGPVLNKERVEGLLEFDKSMVEKMLELFILDAEEVLAAMKIALAKKEFGVIRAKAHRIKGGLVNLGGDHAAHIAGKIEMGEGDIQVQFYRLEKGVHVFTESLNEYLQNS